MAKVGELYQSADWKTEKHVPVIECPDAVAADEMFEVKVTVGKEVAHPNKTEHHIGWIRIFFRPDGGKSAYQIANCEFSAHGASVEGGNTGPVYTDHTATVRFKTSMAGTVFAVSYCNIHGLWESSRQLSLK
ncbi:MAG: class II SORL domain-containing protein [Deltaproteobacteria bacterium]|nr:class II SORL domain-containing protein [Deltaproteobacteria bacterium]